MDQPRDLVYTGIGSEIGCVRIVVMRRTEEVLGPSYSSVPLTLEPTVIGSDGRVVDVYSQLLFRVVVSCQLWMYRSTTLWR
jgi:hypothetical protein